jgi:hypothetical protein
VTCLLSKSHNQRAFKKNQKKLSMKTHLKLQGFIQSKDSCIESLVSEDLVPQTYI